MELSYPPYPAQLLPLPNADNPAAWDKVVGEEMVPIIEPNGVVIGQATREYVHSGSKLLHPVVHLHIVSRMDALYLQKRAATKDLLPGYWDTAVGGHVDYGEFIKEALFREAMEELHLTNFNPYYIDSYVYESDRERELVNVFACIGEFDLKPNPDEVDEGRFWSFKEIKESLGKSVFTPNFETEYLQIHKNLEALL